MSNKIALDALTAILKANERMHNGSAVKSWNGFQNGDGEDAGTRFQSALDNARAAIAALQAEPQGWMPIETAPKDGTTVLVFPASWSNYTASMARWNRDEHAKKPSPYWVRSDCFSQVTLSRKKPPTHWMPLPSPPKD